MKERPILFSAPMVRALLDGSKTQTRRVLKGFDRAHDIELRDDRWIASGDAPTNYDGEVQMNDWQEQIRCPYGQSGDRLYVRETFMDLTGTGVEHRNADGLRQQFAYAAEFPPESYGDSARKDYGLKWKPSIHMPRAASRILLEIVSVRVERLNDISEEDAKAEGIENNPRLDPAGPCHWRHYGREHTGINCPIESYRTLWEAISGAGSWDANPWVWVVEFKRVAP